MKTRHVVMMAAGVSALCGLAKAELRVFDNTGWAFQWNRSYNLPGPGANRGDGLDITLPATQSGAMTDFTLLINGYQPTTSNGVTSSTISQETALMRVANDGAQFTGPGPQGPVTVRGARTYQVGESVGPSASWFFSATVGYYSFATGEVRVLGDSAVIGVQLNMSGAMHYGWVWLEWDAQTPWGNRLQYRPTMWAYETAANTPALVTIPAPGAGSAVMLVAACAGIRRRR